MDANEIPINLLRLMSPEDLRRYATPSQLSALTNSGSNPKLERPSRNQPLATHEAQKADTSRVHIRIVSVRKRLCDPDNLSEKWILDCLRYCRAIRGDEPDKITLETTQRKAAKEEQEHTEVTITY